MPDSTLDPSRAGLFEKLLFDLVTRTKVTVLGASPAAAELIFEGSRALLVRHVPGKEAELQAALRQNLGQNRGALEVVLVGGPPEARALLRKAMPFFVRGSVLLYHLADDGQLWSSKRGVLSRHPLGQHLAAGPVTGPSSAEGWATLAARLAADPESPEFQEARQFSEALRQRRPLATWTLAAVMAVVFALELALGGSESAPTLTRLGALVLGRVQQGEVWRLFSCAFLHAGWVHFLLNVYVLLIVGDVMERLLGPWRFLVLFWLSVLGGSLAALAFGNGALTVGASGGLFGLLVAEGVLAFRPRGLLPGVMLTRARRGAAINLGINVLNSLRPEVALAAHLGGGVVGGLLLAGSALVRGLPRLGEATPAGAGEPTPRWIAPLAWLGAGVLTASLVAALALGQAFRLREPPRWVSRPVGQTGLAVEVPDDLEPAPVTEERLSLGTRTVASWGDVLRDPGLVAVSLTTFDEEIPEERVEAELAELGRGLAKAPAGFELDQPPARARLGALPGFTVKMRQAGGNRLVLEQAAALAGGRLLVIEVLYWPRTEGYAGAAERATAAASQAAK